MLGVLYGNMELIETLEDIENLPLENSTHIRYLTQTTLSVDETQELLSALKKKFPLIKGPGREDICYATTNRQLGVKQLAQECDLILVVGSTTSSN